MTPLSLIRWKMTGRNDEINKLRLKLPTRYRFYSQVELKFYLS